MVLIESVFLLKQSFYRDIHINIFKNSPGFTIINIDVAVSIRVASIAITNVPVDPISALTVDTRVWSTFININLTQLSSIPRHAFTWVAILLWDTSCTICALVSKAAVNYGLTASTYHIEEEKGEKSLLTDLFQLKHLFSYNLIIISYLSYFMFQLFLTSETSDDIIRLCPWSCDWYWKNAKAPSQMSLLGFLHLFNNLIFNPLYAMHGFCFISQRSDFEKISKFWKICNVMNKAWFCKRNA